MKSLVCFQIEGLAPENAVSRLKRAQIGVYRLQKTGKNRLTFCVERKNREKVFTIFRQSCYNILDERPYGAYAFVRFFRSRLGLWLGALLFLAVGALPDRLVMRIDTAGTGAYYREQALAILAENGIAVGGLYRKRNAQTAQLSLLALPDVEYCSLQKQGGALRVEIRIAPSRPAVEAGELTAPCAGKVYSLSPIRGEVLVALGDEVEKGQALVVPEQGDSLVSAGVRLYCTAQGRGQTEEEALARPLLAAAELGAEIVGKKVEKTGREFTACVEYLVGATKNI